MMRAFNKHVSFQLTRTAMAEVLESLLTPEESQRVCAILEDSCNILKSPDRRQGDF